MAPQVAPLALARLRRPKITQAICAILLVQSLQLVQGQLSGDEQFDEQAGHQDIGRISGLAAPAQVAPSSTFVARTQQQQQQQPIVVAAEQSDVRTSGRAATAAARPAGRKPNRITLVARREPLTQSTLTTVSQPALVAAQLPAPSKEQELPAPTYTPAFVASAAPSFESVGPALSSFQSASQPPPPTSQAGSNSVSARHTALMAQVAAERASLIGSEPASSGPLPLGLAPPPQQAHSEALANHNHLQTRSFVDTPSVQLQQPSRQLQQQQQQSYLTAATSAQVQSQASSGEESLAAPTFEQVVRTGCPHKGVFSWENKDHCDRYYLCTNGTFTEEACPNGLAYSQQGAVYQHCAYYWNVDCGPKKTAEPISSPGCPWQFGLFPIVQNGRCSIDYFACEWGVPETKRCSPEGLFYDDRIKGCQWADQLGCKSESLLNFKCPAEDEDNPYWPYPRYYHTNRDVLVCVNEQPRLVHCNDDQLVDPGSLACVDINKKKKKKNF